MLVKFMFKGAVPEKKHSDGRQIYRAIATTPTLDRYGEVVLPRGGDFTNFNNNPVLLEIHQYHKSPVGHIVGLDVSDEQMTFDFVFSTDDRGQELEKKYVDRDMNAFSIGFRPLAKGMTQLWSPWDDEPDIKSIELEVADGSKVKVDLTKYEQVPYRIYHKWDLLEISPVSVPANPDALLMREAEGIIRRAMDQSAVARQFAAAEVEELLAPAMATLAEFHSRFNGDYVIAGAVPKHSTPIVEEKWKASEAKVKLAKWASKDGSGDKEQINWSKYSKGFSWFNTDKADSFGGYKLPHHTVKDGTLKAVWRGVTAAMAALLGARGGTDVGDDSDAVYAHLAKHYKDFDKEPPEKKEYSEEEIKAIEEQPLEGQSAGADGAGDGGDDTKESTPEEVPVGEQIVAMLAQISELAGAVEALTETLDTVNIKVSTLLEASEDTPANEEPPPETEKGDGEERGGEDLEVSKSLVDSLSEFVGEEV